MLPLLFILSVTAVSLYVGCQLSREVTWFTYYLGGMAGLLFSSMIIEVWNRKTKKQEKPEAPRYEL